MSYLLRKYRMSSTWLDVCYCHKTAVKCRPILRLSGESSYYFYTFCFAFTTIKPLTDYLISSLWGGLFSTKTVIFPLHKNVNFIIMIYNANIPNCTHLHFQPYQFVSPSLEKPINRIRISTIHLLSITLPGSHPVYHVSMVFSCVYSFNSI